MDKFDANALDDILEYQEHYLAHYGTKRHSGRYEWGSGEVPYQHEAWFMSRYDQLLHEGKSLSEIADAMGIYTIEKGKMTNKPSVRRLRAQVAWANYQIDTAKIAQIHSLQADGLNNSEIARKMGFNNESSVRSLLKKEQNAKYAQAAKTAEFLEEKLKESGGYLDVGKSAEKSEAIAKAVVPGLSRSKMDTALEILRERGYKEFNVDIEQQTNPGKYTKVKLLCPPGTEYKDLYKDKKIDFENIHSLDDYRTYDNGESFKPSFVYPASMDSKRLKVRYAEDGGVDKDGLIEIRRGVKDLDLGDSSYAQVRILVDGTHYLKGMAAYSDNMPDGVDVVFNTNKHKGTPVMGPKDNTVLKNIDTKNPNNPFGSLIKENGGQSYYDDPNGTFIGPKGQKQSLSLINKRAEEGDWSDWKDTLSAQFLSKQNASLVRKQLDLALKEKELEFKEIQANTNPAVKKKLLDDFAAECDKQSVHLDAASMPRQKYQVLLPLTSISENEVYAPNYNDGEKVALVRYPHGGTFEIPILTVNNSNKEGVERVGKAPLDAIGINKKVADRLSGADFDGDTVMVIPTNERNRIISTPPLKKLEGFDPSIEYPLREGGTPMTDHWKQTQMGVVSNLITDMTLKGASDDELAKAVRHSMVVIDAIKHNYDWKKSEQDNEIDSLKQRYQQQPDGSYGGSSTLISRAKSEIRVPKTQGSDKIDEEGNVYRKLADDLYYNERKKVNVRDAKGKKLKDENGNYIYETDPNTGKYIYADTGKVKMRTEVTTQMANAKDARELISDRNTKIENLYADYANGLKQLARDARLLRLETEKIHVDTNAKKEYEKEVEDLKAQLYMAESNAPKERAAQTRASARVKAIFDANPDIKRGSKEAKKIQQEQLTRARQEVGAKRTTIKLTDRTWEAIQKGALSEGNVMKILTYADPDDWKARSTPKSYTQLSDAKIGRLRSMASTGLYSISEIANSLGVSTSTVSKYLKKDEV